MRRTIVALALALTALPAAAQNTDIEALSGLLFNFGNPGARSLAMGGAFLGLADDASAAEANPAGLTILRRPEVSIEARNYLNTQTFAVTGTFPDVSMRDFNAYSRNVEVGFGSIVYPVGNFAVAAYYHQPVNFRNAINNTTDTPINYFFGPDGLIGPEECANIGSDCSEYRVLPFYTAVDIKMETMGLSAAYKIGNFSLGASARYQTFEEGAFATRTTIQTPRQPLSILAQVSDEEDITFGAGFKWSASDRFSIGGAYKQGAEFDTSIIYADSTTDGFITLAEPAFHVPDTAGLGVSIRPVPQLTINLDAVAVAYSNMMDNFVTFTRDVEAGDFELEDVTEYRAGVEYFFTTRIPVAVRAGWWRDPAHQLRFNGPIRSPLVVGEAILFPGSEDEDHFTGGVGLAWPRFQIDAAYDTSDNYKVGSISMVTRF